MSMDESTYDPACRPLSDVGSTGVTLVRVKVTESHADEPEAAPAPGGEPTEGAAEEDAQDNHVEPVIAGAVSGERVQTRLEQAGWRKVRGAWRR